ncbi:MAG: ubiquinol-cytochrome C chaperone family protein, partial [Hyphomicrobiaceae bacterium]
LNALQQSHSPGGRIARALTEAFVTDMDDTMRELGVGDLSVPKRVKKTAAGLRERTIAYRGADNDAGLLAKKIAEYFEMPPDSLTVRALAAYRANLARSLGQAQAQATLNKGKVSFPAVPAAALANTVLQDGSSNLRT